MANSKRAPEWSDVIWYWDGGRVAGKWRWADAYETGDLAVTKAQIERQGYVAVFGSRALGAPEGPPSEEKFRAIGM